MKQIVSRLVEFNSETPHGAVQALDERETGITIDETLDAPA
jgi:hypothetical protein